MKLYTVRREAPNGDVVVCIHGLLGGSRNVFRLTESIHKAGFSTLAYDQRGHGHSPRGEPDSYGLRQLARDALELLDEQKVERVHFVGHSLGGRVSLLAAAAAPERVLSLTLLDATGKASSDGLAELRAIIDPMPAFFASRADADAFLARYEDPALRQFIRSNLREKEGRWAWLFDLTGIKQSLLPSLAQDVTAEFARITCPIHLVRGENSAHLSNADLDDAVALNPRTTTSLIPNAGHWLHVDNFEATAQAVLSFLKNNRGVHPP